MLWMTMHRDWIAAGTALAAGLAIGWESLPDGVTVLAVRSRTVRVYGVTLCGGTSYGPGSSWLRQDHARRPS